MPGTISPERVSNRRVTVPGQSISRISNEKDTKKIVAKKEEYHFYYQFTQERGARSGEREGCARVLQGVSTLPDTPFSLFTPRFSLLTN
jgi:hypothetical protein